MQIIRNARRIAAAVAAVAVSAVTAQAQFTFTGTTRGCFYGASFGGTTSCTAAASSSLSTGFLGSLTFTGATLNQLAIDNSASFNTLADNFGTFTLVAPLSLNPPSLDGNFFTLMLNVTNPSTATGSMMAAVTGRVNILGASNVQIDFSNNDWFALSPASSNIQAKLNDLSVATGVTNFANGQLRAVTPAVVPEPSTYALMGAGLAGLVGMARRRRSVA